MTHSNSTATPSPTTSNSAISATLIQQVENCPIEIPALKKMLQSTQEQIAEQFHAGEPVLSLLYLRSDLIDTLLQRLWNHFLPDTIEATLLAVGGYGRRELHPFSDVDLLILVDEASVEECGETISPFITLLWDLGLQIGHSVRTVPECFEQGLDDITIATNLIEARKLCGNDGLFAQFQKMVADDDFWPSGPFFAAKRDEQCNRLQKFNDTAYNLEPDIKKGPGGLRDIQNILWVTKRHFGSEKLSELVDRLFLTEEESETIRAGQEELWKIRFALHLIAGRPEERLLFEHQPALAAHFGYSDDDDHRNGAIEKFMHHYFRTLRELSLLNEMLLQLFEETLLTPKSEPKPLENEEGIGRCGCYLTLLPDADIEKNPSLLLSVFDILRNHPELEGMNARTIRKIRSHRHLIDEHFRNRNINRQTFISLFYNPNGLTHTLRRMNRYGVLGAYIPAFEKVIGLMQYDLFHAFTVDEHILFVVRNLRRFETREDEADLPEITELMQKLEHKERLYLAGLFHDIAKGRRGDHSKLGVADAREFCLQHGMNAEEAEEVGWLVSNHLTMSTIAQRRDINDPEEIAEFAQLVQTLPRLQKLYLLTVADIRATNSTLWTHWKSSLLHQLYKYTAAALEQMAQQNHFCSDDLCFSITEQQQQILYHLQDHGLETADVYALWREFDPDYFQRFSSQEILWHTRAILCIAETLPLIRTNPQGEQGGTEIFIYTRNQENLFASLVLALKAARLSIQSARITTTQDNRVLDSFTVLNADGETIHDETELERIRALLTQEINEPTLIHKPPVVRESRYQKHFPGETTVEIGEEPHKPHSLIEIHAPDRMGLLATSAQVLVEHGLHIHNARLAILGERIEILISITHPDLTPLTDEDEKQALQQDMLEKLLSH